MRRFAAACLALALALGATFGALGGPPDAQAASPFTDIDGTTFEGDIEWLWAEGITAGCSPTAYCPDAPVTRGQMASFLVRMFELTEGALIDAFGDDDGTTHEQDINRLAYAGVTKGCTAGLFCPNETVLRREMASFLVRAIPLTEGAGRNYYRDDDGMAQEADIDRLAAAGIASGCGTWRYCPIALVTRGQMAAFLHRIATPVTAPPYPAPGVQERYVSTTGTDADSDCLVESTPCRSIGRAVGQSFDGDVINVGPGTFREQLFVAVGVTIRGAGVGATVLDGGGTARILTIYQGPLPKFTTVHLERSTLTRGRTAGDGGAITNHASLEAADLHISGSIAGGGGGAIYSANGSHLTISRSTFTDNEAGGRGGAILNGAYMTIHSSTFRSNSATNGGAIYQLGYPSIVANSTFVANASSGHGGAIVVDGNGLSVLNSTISQNTANLGGGIRVDPSGENYAELDLMNALIAGNTAPSGRDIAGPVTTQLASIVGVPAGLTLADILDPAGLADNGGPTQTIALTDSATNPAIDNGDAATCAAAPVDGVDQRGEPRTPPCDIGAYEVR